LQDHATYLLSMPDVVMTTEDI